MRAYLVIWITCSIRKTDLDSLDFVVNRFFMKLFHTSNIDTVKENAGQDIAGQDNDGQEKHHA